MYNKISFLKYEAKNKLRIRYNYRMNQLTNTFLHKEYRPHYRRFCSKMVMEPGEANSYISSLIESGEPFWIGRYGNTEMAFLREYLRKEILGKSTELEKCFSSLQINAGFFPNDLSLGEKYAECILNVCHEIDVHGMWPLFMEDYIIRIYEKNVKLMNFVNIEPWSLRKNSAGVLPWSHSLKGKKVLVIHPFEETIKSQYANKRERIFLKRFENADDILPEFELKTLKAVQTIAGTKDERFDTWFDALDWMVQECKKIDFDVAILGCGAYGFPLAAEIKKMGKGAIQLCGATQLMFGIMGNRWKNNTAFIDSMVNESWVSPCENEQVRNMKNVEGACYW